MNETGKDKNNVFCTKIPIRLHYGLLWFTGFTDTEKLQQMRLVVLPINIVILWMIFLNT